LVQRTGSDPRPGDPGPGGPGTATGDAGAVNAAGAPEAAHPRRRFAVRWPVLAWAGGLLLVAAGLFTLYLRQSLLAPVNADGASNMLQAQAMLHGNLLLTGWWSADVSFYTTELPEYMLVEAVRGLSPDVVHLSGALTYTLTVLLGAMLARGRARGREGVVRALLAGGIMLAPAILGGTEIFLENPDHAGTAVPILALFLLLDRAPERWYVPMAVCVLLAWIQVGDQLTLVAATAPIAGVAAARLAMLAVRRRPLGEYRYDAMLLAAAAVSNELANLAEKAIRALGGFDLRPLPQQLIAPLSQVRANAHVMLQSIVLLFGAHNPGNGQSLLDPIAALHWIGLVLAAAGLAVAVATFFLRRTDRVSQIVAAATVATLVAGVFGTLLQNLTYAHEVAILLPFGAVLAGRMLPPLVPARWRARPALLTGVVAPLLTAWLGASLAALCYAAIWTPMAPPEQQLVTWLTSHHYTDGLAEYWQGSLTTVASGGRVLVAPLTPETLQVRRWESSAGWYDPASRTANFVIAATDPSLGDGLSVPIVRAHFGRPAREYVVGTYVVMVYDYNLLTRVTGGAFPGPPGGD
jgi:hypothetical protein